MAFFDSEALAPVPNFDDRPFWESCDAQRLTFQCCARCKAARHPPSPVCPRCRSLETAWKECAGIGQVFTYTVVHHASHEAVKPKLPYVVAVVTFDDVPDVRLVTNITGVSTSDLRIGMRVQLWWDEILPGRFVPRFQPVEAAVREQV